MGNLPRTPAEYRAWWTDNANVPYGYCWCGCDEETPLSNRNDVKRLYFKGEPNRFLHGHNTALTDPKMPGKEEIEGYREAWLRERPNIPFGQCWCGCGSLTTRPKNTYRAIGYLKGQPMRYVSGHNTPGALDRDYVEEDRGFDTPCWVWQGYVLPTGYALKRVAYVRKTAHKFYYEQANGSVPDGHHIHHLCRVKHCVNPSHMVTMDGSEHMRLHQRDQVIKREEERLLQTAQLSLEECKNEESSLET